MSGSDDEEPPREPGRRKDGKPYKDGNTRADGTYGIGRNRTPEVTRFSVGDGRPRGKRQKGVRNADTEFERELNRMVTVREDGKERRVRKGHAVDLRLIANASAKGDNRAIELVDQRRRRIAVEKEETARRYHNKHDHEILEQYLRERHDELNIDPALFGDPETSREGEEAHG